MPLKTSMRSMPSLKYLNMQADTYDAQSWPTLLLRCCGSRHYGLAVHLVAGLFAADRCEWRLLTEGTSSFAAATK
jgi:hypothetical protein